MGDYRSFIRRSGLRLVSKELAIVWRDYFRGTIEKGTSIISLR
jgi:hypothetical protein